MVKWTEEQEKIINSSGNIKINAVAGSGKTTTIVEYARTRPANSKILYLAFNRSVKLEAEKKFSAKKLSNVTIETAHSLAYKHIVAKNGYKLRNSFKTYEITELLGLQGDGEKHGEYIIANHINKLISFYCNSDKQNIEEVNYLETVVDKSAKAFVTKFRSYIEKQAKLLLTKMEVKEIEITHDFYLKKFQLSEPVLKYDYILFDEGQDSSAAMLDVFLKQKAIKVIVGDTHQQIYGWRYAINSLEKVEFKTYHLSTSFRFNQDIADLASKILDRKSTLKLHEPVEIKGFGENRSEKHKAIIARTNLGLLLQAINYVTENRNLKNIYFEGNINSYTYAEDGASLYDVLSLHNGKNYLIKDKLIRSMRNMYELEDYIDKTGDGQLSIMVEIVKEYGNSIPKLIKDLKDKHVDDKDKNSAEIVFSTVHRCKGMEYDTVFLANDFLTEEKLEKLKKEAKEENAKAKLIEEINLLYVAVTRTKNSIHINESLLPKEFRQSSEIIVLKNEPVQDESPEVKAGESLNLKKNLSTLKEKAYTVSEIRKKLPNAYKPWSVEDDEKLVRLFCEGASVSEIATHFSRNKGAIYSRIAKLELEEKI